MTDAGYQEMERFLSETTGLDPESLGSRSIAQAVDAAMEAAGIEGVGDYLTALRSGREGLDRLLEKVVVPETWFFRDTECFNFLRKHVEEKGLAGRESGRIRILSAPCSTGEEPYSIAMVLLEAGLAPERFRIDAVDISPRALETAKRGVYGKGSFRGENGALCGRYFSRTEEGLRMDPAVAGLIHFYRDNLSLPGALQGHERYDVVFCKNLLIYLHSSARAQVIANLDRLLVPHGLLFVGNSEVVSFLDQGYRPVRHARSFACEKCAEPRRPAPAAPAVFRKRRPPAPKPEVQAAVPEKREKAPEAVRQKTGELSLGEIRALADSGALRDALARCAHFLEEHPHHREAYFLMGLIHFSLDSFASAEECFQKVLYLDPGHDEALVHMGLLYEKRGEQGKAAIMRERLERKRMKEAGREESP